LLKLQEDCKASWDHLRAIVKHDNNVVLKIKFELPLFNSVAFLFFFGTDSTDTDISEHILGRVVGL